MVITLGCVYWLILLSNYGSLEDFQPQEISCLQRIINNLKDKKNYIFIYHYVLLFLAPGPALGILWDWKGFWNFSLYCYFDFAFLLRSSLFCFMIKSVVYITIVAIIKMTDTINAYISIYLREWNWVLWSIFRSNSPWVQPWRKKKEKSCQMISSWKSL